MILIQYSHLKKYDLVLIQELGHDPSQYQLQMDHNRQVHILPRSQLDDAEQSKVTRKLTQLGGRS